MSWLLLTAAIVFEVAGTISLKLSQGFTRPVWVAGVIAFYLTSLFFLSMVVRVMPVSTAYAVWSALGTALVAVIGIAVFDELGGLLKVACLALIIVGVAGLHMAEQIG